MHTNLSNSKANHFLYSPSEQMLEDYNFDNSFPFHALLLYGFLCSLIFFF